MIDSALSLLELLKKNRIPFSFDMDGDPAVSLLAGASKHEAKDGWREVVFSINQDNLIARLQISNAGNGPKAPISLFLELYAKSASPRIHNIRILDIVLPHRNIERNGRLCGMTGGFWDTSGFPPASFKYWEEAIEQGDCFRLDSDRTGRCSNRQTPLWVYAEGGQAVWFGPEWSGCWDLEVERGEEGTRIRIGLPTFDFVLRQGKTVRLPGVSLGFAEGDLSEGLNGMRAAVRKHFLPELECAHEAEKPKPPVVFQGLGGMPSFQDEPTLYREADLAAEIGCEAFVLDAGWYMSPTGEDWFAPLGDWEPHPERFPNGMQRFAEHVKAKGMRFGLWWEPRAKGTSKGFKEIEHLLLAPDKDGLVKMRENYGAEDIMGWSNLHLLDLAKQEAQDWAIGCLERLIEEHGADWIWLDFNTDPRTLYWDPYEAPDRKGLMELGFYQGLYRVFEVIHKRHPEVWLETCATGGRCIDLAMARRFHSIWINDGSFEDDPNRNLRSGINRFLPAVYLQNALFIRGDALKSEEPRGDIHFLTHFAGVFQVGQGLVHWKKPDIEKAREFVRIYKEHRHYLEGDFYELFPQPQSLNAWDGWQYHDPETGSGIAILFRLSGSETEVREIGLRGIETAASDGKGIKIKKVAGAGELEVRGDKITVKLEKDSAVMGRYWM